MVMKHQNYHQFLTNYINKSLGKPFIWGERDCITYAIGAIEAMLQKTVTKPEFTYTTRHEALLFAAQWSLIEGMCDQLNAYEIKPNFQQPGDIIIANQSGFECAHVVFDYRAYAPLLNGLVQSFDVNALYQQCDNLLTLRFD